MSIYNCCDFCFKNDIECIKGLPLCNNCFQHHFFEWSKRININDINKFVVDPRRFFKIVVKYE